MACLTRLPCRCRLHPHIYYVQRTMPPCTDWHHLSSLHSRPPARILIESSASRANGHFGLTTVRTTSAWTYAHMHRCADVQMRGELALLHISLTGSRVRQRPTPLLLRGLTSLSASRCAERIARRHCLPSPSRTCPTPLSAPAEAHTAPLAPLPLQPADEISPAAISSPPLQPWVCLQGPLDIAADA